MASMASKISRRPDLWTYDGSNSCQNDSVVRRRRQRIACDGCCGKEDGEMDGTAGILQQQQQRLSLITRRKNDTSKRQSCMIDLGLLGNFYSTCSDRSNVGSPSTERFLIRWINSVLSRSGNDLIHVKDLFHDLRDGTVLCRLLAELSGIKIVYHRTAKFLYHRMDNITNALQFMADQLHVKTSRWRADRIESGQRETIVVVLLALLHLYFLSSGSMTLPALKNSLSMWVCSALESDTSPHFLHCFNVEDSASVSASSLLRLVTFYRPDLNPSVNVPNTPTEMAEAALATLIAGSMPELFEPVDIIDAGNIDWSVGVNEWTADHAKLLVFACLAFDVLDPDASLSMESPVGSLDETGGIKGVACIKEDKNMSASIDDGFNEDPAPPPVDEVNTGGNGIKNSGESIDNISTSVVSLEDLRNENIVLSSEVSVLREENLSLREELLTLNERMVVQMNAMIQRIHLMDENEEQHADETDELIAGWEARIAEREVEHELELQEMREEIEVLTTKLMTYTSGSALSITVPNVSELENPSASERAQNQLIAENSPETIDNCIEMTNAVASDVIVIDPDTVSADGYCPRIFISPEDNERNAVPSTAVSTSSAPTAVNGCSESQIWVKPTDISKRRRENTEGVPRAEAGAYHAFTTPFEQSDRDSGSGGDDDNYGRRRNSQLSMCIPNYFDSQKSSSSEAARRDSSITAVRVYMLDNSSKAMSVSSETTVTSLLASVFEKLSLSSQSSLPLESFGLWFITKGNPRLLHSDEIIIDLFLENDGRTKLFFCERTMTADLWDPLLCTFDHEEGIFSIRNPSKREKNHDCMTPLNEIEGTSFEDAKLKPLVAAIEGWNLEESVECDSKSHIQGILENSQSTTSWYCHYFVGNDHSNYFGIDKKRSLTPESFMLSFIKECTVDSWDEDVFRASYTQYRVILWRSCGAEHLAIPVRDKQIFSAQQVLRRIAPSLSHVKLQYMDGPNVQNELLKCEDFLSTDRFKFGVLAMRPGQTSEDEMFGNQLDELSDDFTDFLSCLGDRMPLHGWPHFRGGLDVVNNTTGHEMVYTRFGGNEIMFHVAPFLPHVDADKQQLEKKRHLGNDIAVIVFIDVDEEASKNTDSEPVAVFDPRTISSHFIHVYAVVQVRRHPVDGRKLFALTVTSKTAVPPYGPSLPDPCLLPPEHLRSCLLAKLINGESSTYRAEEFRQRSERTMRQLIDNIQIDLVPSKVLEETLFTPLDSGHGHAVYKWDIHAHGLLGVMYGCEAMLARGNKTIFKATTHITGFPHEVLCSDRLNDKFLLGTENGLYLYDGQESMSRIHSHKERRIVQLSVFPEQGIVVLLGKCLQSSSFRRQVYRSPHISSTGRFYLLFFQLDDLSASSESNPWTGEKVTGTRSAHLFASDISVNGQLHICVAVKKVITLYRWSPQAKDFQRLRQIVLPEVCKTLSLEGTSAIVAFGNRFAWANFAGGHIKDREDHNDGESKNRSSLSNWTNRNSGDLQLVNLAMPPEYRAKRMTMQPVDILSIGSKDFLLCFNHIGLFYNHDGYPSRNYNIKWTAVPHSVVYAYPNIIAFSSTCVEVRTLINGNLVQIIPIRSTHFLAVQSSQKLIYIANTTTGPQPRTNIHCIGYSC